MSIISQINALKNKVGGGLTSAVSSVEKKVQDVQKDDSWMGRAMRFAQKYPTPVDYGKSLIKPTEEKRMVFDVSQPKIPYKPKPTFETYTKPSPFTRARTKISDILTGESPETRAKEYRSPEQSLLLNQLAKGKITEEKYKRKLAPIQERKKEYLKRVFDTTPEKVEEEATQRFAENIVGNMEFGGLVNLPRRLARTMTVEGVKKLLGKKSAEYSDDVIKRLAKERDEKVIGGLLSKESPLIQEARKYKSAEEFVKAQGAPLYHGTPYEFDKFDISKINTGEMSQSFGKGLYLSDSPSVANYYKNTITKSPEVKIMSFDGKPISKEAQSLLSFGWNKNLDEIGRLPIEKQKTELAKAISKVKSSAQPSEYSRKIIQELESIDPESLSLKVFDGKTMEVSANTEALKTFLDFSKKPTEKQISSLKKRLGENYLDWDKIKNGDELFSKLNRKLKNPEKILEESGIYGIRYDVGTLSGGREAGNNYVFFRDSDLKTKSQLTDIWNKSQPLQGGGRVGLKNEFKVGDVIDTQGGSNMKSPVKIREITGNTIKFTDAEGTDFAGMQRADLRRMIKGDAWKLNKVPPQEGVEKVKPKKGILQIAREEKLAKKEGAKTFEIQKETFAEKKQGILERAKAEKEAIDRILPDNNPRHFAGKKNLLVEDIKPKPREGLLRIQKIDKSKNLSYTENMPQSEKKSIYDADKILTSPTEKNPAKQGVFNRAVSAYKRGWTKLREVVQDDWIRIKNLQRDKNIKIDPKKLNPYEAETLMHGRLATRIKDADEIVRNIDKDILKTSKNLKLNDTDLKADIYEYLLAKHAPERNVALGEKAAGITTKEAGEIMSEIKLKPHFKEVERISNDIKKLNNEVLDILHDSQVIDDDLFNTLRNKYKEHIPLNRVMDEGGDIGQSLTSRGLSVKGSGIKRAKGSEREIDDILKNVVSNYKQAIVRSEKNRVNLATLNFARENKNLGIFEEVKPPMIPVAKIEHRAGIDRQYQDELAKFASGLFGKTQTKGQPGRRLGYYTPSTKEITRHFGTPREVQTHETAHHIDEMFGLRQLFYKRGETKNVAEEMLKHMENIGESANRMKKSGERFADSFEWWLTHRDLAQKDIPLFSKKIESIINEIPELKPLLDIRPRAAISIERMDEIIFRESPFGVVDPLVLTIREKGKPVYLKIKDEGLAKAFQGLGKDKMPELFKFVNSFTRFYSGLATRFNPEFAFSNKIRDLQEMAVYMASQEGVGFKGAAKTTFRDSASMKSVLEFIRGKDTPGAKLYKQMQLDGGTTGGMSLSTRNQIELNLENIAKINRSNPRKAAKYVIEKIDQWNTIFEDSTRLSVYKTALDNGMTRDEAAVLAKNATLNFNKKGTGGAIINSLYMFSNASIQGSAKLLKAMKNPKVAGAVVGSVGIATFAVNKWNDSIDENWREKVDKWDRTNNLVVMYPTEEGSKYFTIPVSWGIKPIKVSADYAYDASTGKLKGVKEAVKGILGSAFDAYNPTGGTDVMSAATPTFLDVPSEISRNKKWTGSEIKPEEKEGVKESQRFFQNKEGVPSDKSKTFGILKKTSEKLSKAGIEISPADIKYAYDQYIGGTGRSVVGLTETINSAIKGKIPQAKDIPFIRRFYKEKTEEELEKSKFFEKKKGFFEEMKELPEGEEKTNKIQDYVSSFPGEKRQGVLYGLMQEGVKTKGVSGSENVIKAKELYKQWKELPDDERTQKISEWAKTVDEDEADKIIQQVKEQIKNDVAKKSGLEDGWFNMKLDERAILLYDKTKDMPNNDMVSYLENLIEKELISENLLEKYVELRTNKLNKPK